MTRRGARHGDVRNDTYVFLDVISNMMTSCVRASARAQLPRHPPTSSHGMYIVTAGRLKLLPGGKMFENGHLCVVGYKKHTSSRNFRECHIDLPGYLDMVLGMHVILPISVQIFVGDEPKNTRVIQSFSNCHEVDM